MNDIDNSELLGGDPLFDEDDDDEIIDLTDSVPSGASSQDGDSPSADEDEEILDLADIAASPADGGKPPADAAGPAAPLSEDDEILDLIDRVESEAPSPSEVEGVDGLIDSILEDTLEFEEEIEEELGTDPEPIDDFVEDLGLDIDEDLADEGDPDIAAQGINLPAEQIEKALERVVTKVFSDRIEALLISVVEETVKDEIEKLKALIDRATDEERT